MEPEQPDAEDRSEGVCPATDIEGRTITNRSRDPINDGWARNHAERCNRDAQGAAAYHSVAFLCTLRRLKLSTIPSQP